MRINKDIESLGFRLISLIQEIRGDRGTNMLPKYRRRGMAVPMLGTVHHFRSGREAIGWLGSKLGVRPRPTTVPHIAVRR